MKKLLALSFALLVLLAACSGGAVKTGLGHSVKLGIQNHDNGVLKRARADAIFVAASFDNNGKILSVSIDNAQVDANVKEDGTLDTEKSVAGPQQSKQDKKDNYGMKGSSGIGKEWYEQANALEDWMTGKTITEVTGMKTKAGADAGHPSVPDVSDLATSVTIDVGDYLAAVQNAYDNAK